MRTEALTGSITTYTSGESWSNKGHKKDKKGKNSRWWKSHEKWIYILYIIDVFHLQFVSKKLKVAARRQSMRTRDLNKLYCKRWDRIPQMSKLDPTIGQPESLQIGLSKKDIYICMYVRNITTPLHYLSNFNLSWKDFGFSFGRLGRIRSIITHPLH